MFGALKLPPGETSIEEKKSEKSHESVQIEIPMSPESVSLISGIVKEESPMESVQQSEDISPVLEEKSHRSGLAEFALKIERSVMDLADLVEAAELQSQEQPEIGKISERTLSDRPQIIGEDNAVLAAERLLEKSLPPPSVIEDLPEAEPEFSKPKGKSEENAVIAIDRLVEAVNESQ